MTTKLRARCQDCQRSWDEDELLPFDRDRRDELMPGQEIPLGSCPGRHNEAGAVHPEDEDNACWGACLIEHAGAPVPRLGPMHLIRSAKAELADRVTCSAVSHPSAATAPPTRAARLSRSLWWTIPIGSDLGEARRAEIALYSELDAFWVLFRTFRGRDGALLRYTGQQYKTPAEAAAAYETLGFVLRGIGAAPDSPA